MEMSGRRSFLLGLCSLPAAGIARANIGSSIVLRRAKKMRWMELTAGRIDVSIEAGSKGELLAEEVKRRLASAEARVEHILGEPLRGRVRALIAGSRQTTKALLGQPVNGFAIGDVAVMVFGDTIDAIGPHELCHVWSARMWGKPAGEWITEGLAVHADGRWHGVGLHANVRRLQETKRLIPLASLVEKRWGKAGYSDLVTYPQAGSFVQYLFTNYKREIVRSLWRQGRSASRIEAVLGKPLEHVESEWLREVQTSPATKPAAPLANGHAPLRC